MLYAKKYERGGFMQLKISMVSLGVVMIFSSLNAGRFDIDFDVKNERQRPSVGIYDPSSRSMQVKLLNFGLNSFEDVPEYKTSSASNVPATLLIKIIRNEEQPSLYMKIESGSLITVLGYGMTFDPQMLGREMIETKS